MKKILFLSIITLFLIACGDDDKSTEPTLGYVEGTVKNTAGSGIEGVTVTSSNGSAETTDSGYYKISSIETNVNSNIMFTKAGHASNMRTINVTAGEGVNLDVTLGTVTNTVLLDASAEIVVNSTPTGGSISIPANSIVNSQGETYQGLVNVGMDFYSSTDENERSVFPGPYQGQRADNTETFIVSYGFGNFSLVSDNGDELFLDESMPATITYPVNTALPALDSIPLWYFDFDQNLWIESGEATRTNNTFNGQVTRTGIWNIDMPVDNMVTIRGCVATTDNAPLQNAIVEAIGINWVNGDLVTDQEGKFDIEVPANSSFSLLARIGALSARESDFTIQGSDLTLTECLTLNPPVMTIKLTWGENPEDLDTMFTGLPTGSANGFIVYFADLLDEETSTFLDVDDVTSYGPEILAVPNLPNGTYRYSVNHYSGSSNISDSSAVVELNIKGQPTIELTPPAGASAVQDLWVLWDFEVLEGQISVNEINTVYPAAEANQQLYPPTFRANTMSLGNSIQPTTIIEDKVIKN